MLLDLLEQRNHLVAHAHKKVFCGRVAFEAQRTNPHQQADIMVAGQQLDPFALLHQMAHRAQQLQVAWPLVQAVAADHEDAVASLRVQPKLVRPLPGLDHTAGGNQRCDERLRICVGVTDEKQRPPGPAPVAGTCGLMQDAVQLPRFAAGLVAGMGGAKTPLFAACRKPIYNLKMFL